MREPATTTVEVNGHSCRVWSKGSGPKLGFLAGFGGLPRWMPFLDLLAEERQVIVPSLPGFPGATGHSELVSHLDWLVAVRQLLDKSGLNGADLAGSSVGASFVAEVAAMWPQSVGRIAIAAPFGLFDADDAPADPWAQKPRDVAALLCANPDVYEAMKAAPEGANSIEWPIEQTRAAEVAARVFWPLGDTGLIKRLPLVTAPTLVLWGEHDRLMPRSYAGRIANAISGPSEVRIVEGAGHLAELDAPDAFSRAIVDWTAVASQKIA